MDIKEDIAVVDLFCGIGGLSHGFVQEGFNIVGGFDNDPSCKFAFEKNNNSIYLIKDITTLEGKELDKLFEKKIKILVGCAPCQPFSSYSFKIKDKDPKKMNLLYSFSRLVEETNPSIVSMENVPQLLVNKNGIFQDFCENLKRLGYYIHYEVVYCPDYGIPQTRKRLVLLASKLGEIEIIPKTHTPNNYVTVRETIIDLPPIAAGEYNTKDPLHRARALNPINLERIQNTKEGGGWKDWPKELLLKCYKKESGKTYSSVYGRMKWDAPSPTMTTHCTGLGNGRFGHPNQNRAISLREASLLQTFPMEYVFFDNIENFKPSILSRQIGNAVPPKLGQVIAKSIKLHLEKFDL
jgi:DNA (cytosine-5)-methyltransferase 1